MWIFWVNYLILLQKIFYFATAKDDDPAAGDYFFFLLSQVAANPDKPMPMRNIVAGSGIGED